MVETATTKSASNWDFTRVSDLLKSPIFGGNSDSARYDTPQDAPSGEGRLSGANTSSAKDLPGAIDCQQNPPRLGDLSLIWKLLHQEPTLSSGTSAPEHAQQPTCNQTSAIPVHDEPANDTTSTTPKSIPVTSTSKPRITKATVKAHPSVTFAPSSSTAHQPIAILTRTSEKLSTTRNVADASASRTPPRVVEKTNKSSAYPNATIAGTPSGKANKSVDPDSVLSESSTSADSDSSTVVFDRPFSKKSGVLAFVPSQVGSVEVGDDHLDTPPSSYDDADWTLNSAAAQNIVNTSAGIKVLPAAYKTATDRRVGLITKLLRDFPEYAQLVSCMGRLSPTSKESDEARPIHVFVDMSNIMVGFHDSVKVSRNIPITTRIRRLHLSFANFSLIMERGRSAAKRVLVGSDRLPAITEAEQLGYETNILDRVHKVKHTTPRPFKTRKAPGFASHPTYGSETVGTSGERWVEQAVDEILHLKMLESIVDSDEPSTIVLATGDAAVAEYSGGFMRMVERALTRGWNVELVSFSQVTSYAYRKKEFRAKWGPQFRMIELDSYVEELFD